MRFPRPKSTLARAVLPVFGGIAGFAIGGLLLWLVAAYASGNPNQTSDRLNSSEWTVGPVDSLAATIAQTGPLLFRQPGGAETARAIVIDHVGSDPTDGWQLYQAFPLDRDQRCPISQIEGQRTFRDCEGRTVGVESLAVPTTGVYPRVDDDTTLVIDFRGERS